MPESIFNKGVGHDGLSELILVESMHERKAKMADLADGFIALPGGLGTLEELFEVLTMSQLGIHQKPCGLLNIDGYYNKLIEFLYSIVEQKFMKQVHRDMLLTDDDPADLIERMETEIVPNVDKWIIK